MANALNHAGAVLVALLAECDSLAGSLSLLDREDHEVRQLAEQIARLRDLSGRLDALAPRYYVLTDEEKLFGFDSSEARGEAAERMSMAGSATYYLTVNPADAPEALSAG